MFIDNLAGNVILIIYTDFVSICFQGDEFEESSGSHEYRKIILQQSVTMLAYMDRTTQNTTMTSGIAEPRMLLGFSISDVTILIGAVIGMIAFDLLWIIHGINCKMCTIYYLCNMRGVAVD